MRRTGSLIADLLDLLPVRIVTASVVLVVLLGPGVALSVESRHSTERATGSAAPTGGSKGQAVGAFVRRWSARKLQYQADQANRPRGWARVRQRTGDIVAAVKGSTKVRSVIRELGALFRGERRVTRAAMGRIESLVRDVPPLSPLVAWLQGRPRSVGSTRVATAVNGLRSVASRLVETLGEYAGHHRVRRLDLTLAFLAVLTLQAHAFHFTLQPSSVPDKYTKAYHEILLKKGTDGPSPAMPHPDMHIVGSEDFDYVVDEYGAGHLLVPLHRSKIEINPDHLKLGTYELYVRTAGENKEGTLEFGMPKKILEFSKDSFRQRLICERKAPNWVHYRAKNATMATDGKTQILLPYGSDTQARSQATKGAGTIAPPAGQQVRPVALARGGASHALVQRGKQHEVVVERKGGALIFDLAKQGPLPTSLGVRLAPPAGQRASASLTKGSYMIGPTPKGPWTVLEDDVHHLDNDVRRISLAAAAADSSLRYLRVGFNWYVPDAQKMVANFAFSSDPREMIAKSDTPGGLQPSTADGDGPPDESL